MNNEITIKPYAPNIGAIITGIDLSKEISNSELKIIKDAFHKFLVIFFKSNLKLLQKIISNLANVLEIYIFILPLQK